MTHEGSGGKGRRSSQWKGPEVGGSGGRRRGRVTEREEVKSENSGANEVMVRPDHRGLCRPRRSLSPLFATSCRGPWMAPPALRVQSHMLNEGFD